MSFNRDHCKCCGKSLYRESVFNWICDLCTKKGHKFFNCNLCLQRLEEDLRNESLEIPSLRSHKIGVENE